MRRSTYLGFLCAIALGLVLYLPLRSNWFDLNGIGEARGVEGTLAGMFNSNHTLYQPIGFLSYQLARLLGYAGVSAPVLQVTTALFGTLGLGFAFLAFRNLAKHVAIALALTAGLAISWTYWSFSTDIAYIIPAGTIAAGAIAWCTYGRFSNWSCVGLGLVGALCILLWQASVFLIPALAVGMLLSPRRARLSQVGLFAATAVVVTVLSYVAVGVLAYHKNLFPDAILFPLSYRGGRLPMWGRFGIERFPLAAIHEISSIMPLGPGLQFSAVPQRIIASTYHVLSAAALIVVVAWFVVVLRRCRREGVFPVRSVSWLAAGLALFWFWITWWDPWEPKWFVIPNILLLALIASVWGARPVLRYDMPIWLACVAIVAVSNLATTVGPRRATTNPAIVTAGCTAEHMKDTDLLLVADWSWNAYLDYFYHRQSLLLIGETVRLGSKDAVIAKVRKLINEKQGEGAQIYLSDTEAYPPDYMTWLAAQSGLTREDFRRLDTQPAFVCNGVSILLVKGFKQE